MGKLAKPDQKYGRLAFGNASNVKIPLDDLSLGLDVIKADLSIFREARLTAQCFNADSGQTGTNPVMRARFSGSAEGTYHQMGATEEIEIPVDGTGWVDSGWINLADEAHDDVYVTLYGEGGDLTDYEDFSDGTAMFASSIVLELR